MPPPDSIPEASSAAEQVRPGTRLGDFTIVRKLGDGGMGCVFLAQQLSLDRPVAVKVIAPQIAADREHVLRFVREMRLTAQLDHPGIVSAVDAGEAEGVYYLAMAYIQGETLQERVRRCGALPEKEALQVGRAVAVALQYAWGKRLLLHLDVKPGNIMLTADGGIKLMDLGLAQVAENAGCPRPLGPALGTPQYISPEQARGDRALDFRSDVYSLGATLYYALTGERPFPEATPREAIDLHCNGPVPNPRRRNPRVSEATAVLVQRLMAKSPEARAADWGEVVAALGLLSASGPEVTAPVPAHHPVLPRQWEPVLTAWASHPWYALAVVAALLGLIVLLLLVLLLT